jgi:hypothetical protein
MHPACSAFLKRIFDSGIAVVTSDLLAVELAESALITCDHGDMASEPHVTLSGNIVGEYIVKDRRPNGALTLVPDTYPAVVPEYDGRPATAEEFAAHRRGYRPASSSAATPRPETAPANLVA